MPAKERGAARFRSASDQSLLIYFAPHSKESRGEAVRSQSQSTREANEQVGKREANERVRTREANERITKREANERVRKLVRLLELEPLPGVRNLHPAYDSLLVKFDAHKWRHSQLQQKLRKYLDRIEEVELPPTRLVEIPVCYGGEFGPDLNHVAALHGVTPERVIELHASTEYLVYFLGFVPGFAYLGELPEALVTPRLATPRRKVPAGSVGIAGNQTGVYPFETPGGWRLLGRTPTAMFQADRDGMSLLSIGDRVRFKQISSEQFAALREQQNTTPPRHSERSAAQ